MALNERELNQRGYFLNLTRGLWQRTLRQSKVVIPGRGAGLYIKCLMLDIPRQTPFMEDGFLTSLYWTRRIISPYPVNPSKSMVKITAGPSSASPDIDSLLFSCVGGGLAINRRNSYHAFFKSSGQLTALDVSVDPATRKQLKFYLQEGQVKQVKGNEVLAARSINWGENEVALGNIGYLIDQKPSATKVAFGLFGQPDSFTEVTIPTTLRPDYLRPILTRGRRPWLNLGEHIPARVRPLKDS